MVSVSAAQGQSSSSGACSMVARAPRIISPQEGAGGSDAKSEEGQSRFPCTTAAATVERQLHQERPGNLREARCASRMRPGGAPSARVAST